MEEPNTFIEFIFIPELKDTNLNVKLDIAKLYNKFSISKSIIIPKTNFKKGSFYYTELFIIYKENNNIKDNIINKIDDKEEEDVDKIIPEYIFQMPIYYGIINYIFYDVNEKKSPTIEMLFFGKNYLPSQIKYKTITLDKFQNNNNKYRKRICLANVNVDQLEYTNEIKFINEGYQFYEDSFQLLLRIPEDFQKIQYSLALIKYAKLNDSSKKKEILIEEEEIIDLKNFKSKYLNFLKNVNKFIPKENNPNIQQLLLNNLQSLKEIHNTIEEDELFFEFLMNPLNFKLFQNSFELIQDSFFLNEFIYLNSKDSSISNFYNLKNYINRNNLLEKNFYKNLEMDKSLNQEEKIKILRTIIIFFAKAIKSKNTIENIDYINIEKIKKNNNIKNPYFKAVKLVNDIIDNIDEDSRLFEAFLHFDSGKIENYLEKIINDDFTTIDIFEEKIQHKMGKYKSEFGFNLLNITQIKSHLKQLIPKFIIRAETNIKFNAYYEKETNIMILNEFRMFNQSIDFMDKIFMGDDLDKYVIPITIEILHEMMSHGKLRISDKNQITPRFYRDSKNSFEYKSIYKNIEISNKKYELMPVPESGRILENYISENREVINSLKTPSNENTILINYKYWVQPNFDLLEQHILQSKKNNCNFNANNLLVDEMDIYDSDDCYIDRSNKY